MASPASVIRGLLSALGTIAIAGIAARPCVALAQSGGSPFRAEGVVVPEGGVLSIGTAATGVVERIVGGPGQPVRLGEELVKVDCAPLEASVKSLAGQSAAAQAADDRVRNGPRPAEIAVGEANLGVAKARAEEAADALRRAQGLQVGISVTQAAKFQIERAAKISAAQLADAQARLDLLRSGSRAEDIAEADARRDAAAAALEEAKARLAQCSVPSPIDGVVVARFVSKGQFVSAAVPVVLLELENDRSLAIRAALEAVRFAELCRGQRASVTAPGDAQGMAATVERIAPPRRRWRPRLGEAPQGQVTVTVRLEHWGAGLFAGEAVSVRFEPCGR